MQNTTQPADVKVDSVISDVEAEIAMLNLEDRVYDISGGYEFTDAERAVRMQQMRELSTQIPALAILANA